MKCSNAASLPIRAMSEIEANFKTLNKALLNIGQNLYSNKEARELFVNVVDKVNWREYGHLVKSTLQCALFYECYALFYELCAVL